MGAAVVLRRDDRTNLQSEGVQAIATLLQGLRPIFEIGDSVRRVQAAWLKSFGFGPDEARYDIIASGPLWRLRRYRDAGPGPAALLVPAPIKSPDIWDLAPGASVVRRCLSEGFQVYLMEWRPPTAASECRGLAAYAEEAISGAVQALTMAIGPTRPILVGHSLGGTLTAIYAGLFPGKLSGLVLLSAPLCFGQADGGYAAKLSAIAPQVLSEDDVIPGSLLTQLSVAASPATFVFSRLSDAVMSASVPGASRRRLRIERWALDEVPLSGRLARDVLQWLYAENRLCRAELEVAGRKISPERLSLPILAVANSEDDVAPPASVRPYFEAMPHAETRLIEYMGEAGIVLQHLGVLVGPEALGNIWPEIIAWMKDRGTPAVAASRG